MIAKRLIRLVSEFPETCTLFLASALVLASGGNALLPALLIFVCGVVLISGLALHQFLAQLFFFTLPFTLDVVLPGGSNIGMPGEALALLFAGTALFSLRKHALLSNVLSSPLALSGAFFLIVLFTGLLFTNDVRVSMKYVLIQLVYFLSGGILTFSLLQSGSMQWRTVFTSLAIGFALVSAGFLLTADFSFNLRSAAPLLARPFFKDHTVYSATICLITPFGYAAAKHAASRQERLIWIGWTCFMMMMILIASSRAAWLSFFISLVMLAIFQLKIKFRWIFFIFLVSLMVAYLNSERLVSFFESNRHDSNRFQSSLREQALSVANISSDVSNLERLNRWKCAWRMFKERPLTGFGPGTYQFNYMPFQLRSEMTRISVQSQFYIKPGRGGTAHSEYLLALSECGLPGLLSWIFIILSVFFTGVAIIERGIDPHQITRVACALAALTAYFVHAVVNNFLTNANPGILFWMICGLMMHEYFVFKQTKKAVTTSFY